MVLAYQLVLIKLSVLNDCPSLYPFPSVWQQVMTTSLSPNCPDTW